MTDILHQIAEEDTEKITFHFTPGATEHLVLKSTLINDGLFVRTTGDLLYPVQVKHPITSIA
ncbi:hypothetical protein [Paenibacillus xylanilyticus]|uniref:hypothetical protein n=1 Tax=Paenibacillus xylanilyticus TaxID=248903 RepID=UPI00399EF7F7